MLLLKFGGLFLIFAASSLFGVYKAFTLKKRGDKLQSICFSLSKLAELVRNGAGELQKILELSFQKEILIFENGKPIISCSFLLKDDVQLAESFLGEIGMLNSESEYKRVILYKTLFEQKATEAMQRSQTLSRLYTSLGVLIGLSICIFLV